jgi:hypothetical protein
MGGRMSILVCLLAVVGTRAADSAAQFERQEYHSVPDWTRPALQSAFVAEGEWTLRSGALPVVKEPLPPEVAASIHNVAENCYRAYIQANETGGGYLPMTRLYGPVFRLKAPEARNLYVFTLYDGVHCAESEKWFYFLLFDPQSRKVSRNCPCVRAERMRSGLFCGPLVHFFDVNLDGRTELAVQKIVRNGTMYDAAIYYYYRVTADMDLLPLFALEARAVDLYSDERGLIVRTLERLGSNRLRIDVALEDPAGTPHHQQLGTVILEAKDGTSPFEVVERNVRISRYAGCLLTASSRAEQALLKDGYRAGWEEEKVTDGSAGQGE